MSASASMTMGIMSFFVNPIDKQLLPELSKNLVVTNPLFLKRSSRLSMYRKLDIKRSFVLIVIESFISYMYANEGNFTLLIRE